MTSEDYTPSEAEVEAASEAVMLFWYTQRDWSIGREYNIRRNAKSEAEAALQAAAKVRAREEG